MISIKNNRQNFGTPDNLCTFSRLILYEILQTILFIFAKIGFEIPQFHEMFKLSNACEMCLQSQIQFPRDIEAKKV